MPATTPDPSLRVQDRGRIAVAAALAATMLLTRFGHLGELSRLPDASWAVFFLGGLALRDARHFAAFFGLAWAIDLAAVALGTPADCFSPAYLFLVPAYGALWWGGRLAASLLEPVAGSPPRAVAALHAVPRRALAVATLPVAVVLAFVLSNAGVFLLGSDASATTAAQYAASVSRYLPGYLLVTLAYAGTALAAHAVAGRFALSGRGSRDSGRA